MLKSSRSLLCRSRHRKLAACIATVFSLSVPVANAASTWTVTSCDDNGAAGTLRTIVAAATTLSGDTIDLRELPTTYSCSTISLKTGAIDITQADLTLQGPGADALVITRPPNVLPNYFYGYDRLVKHTGTGNLKMYDLSLSAGYLLGAEGTDAKGGCIYSAGNVTLTHVHAFSCSAEIPYTGKTAYSKAAGGAVFSKGSLTLSYSTLERNSAGIYKAGHFGGGVYGGAAASLGPFSASNSAISGNGVATGSFTSGIVNIRAVAGGLYVRNSATIAGSTISGNSSSQNDGGIYLFSVTPGTTTTITNSTISGNSAGNIVGGISLFLPSATIQNSTIAFNTAGNSKVYQPDISGTGGYYNYYAAGLALNATPVNLQSSLIANNTVGQNTDYDLTQTFSGSVDATSANNLVRVSGPNTELPANTITSSCPLLGPLRNNGGPTPTHALLSHSPGIDQGNNAAGLPHDQRGIPYARVSGAQADIGAYEVQKNDIVFNTGFEGCP